MKALIAEDDFTSRLVLQGILKKFGDVHLVGHGKECVEAYCASLKNGSRFDLICLDITMPEMDGLQALKYIRKLEAQVGIPCKDEVKVLMTTVVDDSKNDFKSDYTGWSTSYLVKPIHAGKVVKELYKFGLIENTDGA